MGRGWPEVSPPVLAREGPIPLRGGGGGEFVGLVLRHSAIGSFKGVVLRHSAMWSV